MAWSTVNSRPSAYADRERSRAPWWLRLLARFAFRYRLQLVPVWVAIAVVLGGWAAGFLRATAGDRWLLGVAVAGALLAVLWVRSLADSWARSLGAATVAIGGAFAGAIAYRPTIGALYGAWAIVAIAGGGLWWWGPIARHMLDLARLRDRFASTTLGKGGATIVDLVRSASGTRLRVRLDRSQPFATVNRETLAHELDVPASRVIVEQDKRSGRSFTARLLNVDATAARSLTHPAIEPGADRAGPWLPGCRTITDPVPLGVTRDDDRSELHLYRGGDVQHGLLGGKTGSGKSNTLNVLAVAVACARDAILWASDAPKGGATFKPWAACVANLATTAEATRAQMIALRAIIAYRCGVVANSNHDKWRPSPATPAIVYVIEEAAALFGRDPDLADLATELILTGRQAGVCVVIVSQGADWESIPTRLRDQLDWIVVHKLSAGALKVMWPAALGVIDLGLFETPGLLYVQDGGGLRVAENLLPVLAYPMHEPPVRRALAERYGPYQPQLDAGSARAIAADELPPASVPAPAPAGPDLRARLDQARRELVDAGELVEAATAAAPDLPTGPIRAVFDLVDPPAEVSTPEDERVTAALLVALGEAGREGAAKSDLAAKVSVSPETALRRLTRLRAQGRIEAFGGGGSTRWRLVEVPAGVS